MTNIEYSFQGTFNIETLDTELESAHGTDYKGSKTGEEGIGIIVVMDDSVLEATVQTTINAHDPNVLSDAQQIQAVQANSDSQAASIPAWASWNEAAALAWHDTNITDEFPVGNLTEANALLQTMATENRNMIRMIIAMRNKLWPNLEDNS